MNEKKVDMAQIPYIVHKKRLFKAYQREMRLTIALVLTNTLWLIGTAFLLVR